MTYTRGLKGFLNWEFAVFCDNRREIDQLTEMLVKEYVRWSNGDMLSLCPVDRDIQRTCFEYRVAKYVTGLRYGCAFNKETRMRWAVGRREPIPVVEASEFFEQIKHDSIY